MSGLFISNTKKSNAQNISISEGKSVHLYSQPVQMNPEFVASTFKLHYDLHQAIIKSLASWWSNPGQLKLNPKIEQLFLSYECPLNSPIGSYRPDLLFTEQGEMKICEVNARFTLNGYFLSVELANLVKNGHFEEQVFPAPLTLRFPKALKDRFTNDTVFCIVGKEPSHDMSRIDQYLPSKKVMASELVVRGDKLFVGDELVTQCILELHQDEIEILNDDVIRALMDLSVEGKCLNPLWTIFIVHDKRWLKNIATFMENSFIIDTFTDLTVSQLKCVASCTHNDLLVKPALFGKGEGIAIGRDESFIQKVDQLSVPWILQPFVKQKMWDIGENRQAIVGTLLTMDGLSYGPGVFRSSAQQLVALGTGGIALAPSIPSPSPFKNTLFIEKSLKPLEQEKIQSVLDSLHESGIVVVSTPVNDICPENFQEMLQSLGAISQEHNKEGTFCWTINAKLSTTARSHTSEAFLVHTDASFEDSPPRYFALAIKHQDCTGAGETSLASIEDAVSQLTEVQKKILRTTVVKWTIPPEFNRGIPYVKGTVLFSNTMGRFRKDIIDTSDLTKENAELFWDAYNTIDNILANSCEKNKSVLPEGSIVIIDNWKYVHSRKQFNDLNRLLYRVRFNLSSPQTPLVNKKMLLAKLTPEILSKRGLYWSPSGGTTSRGYSCDFCLPASYEENNKLRRDMSELFKIHGAFDGRVAVNLMSAGHLYRGLEVFQDLFTRGGLTELPLGFEISDEELFANINRFDASILCGYPSRIIQFCVYLKNNNLILPLTSIIYGGERFFDYQKQFCRKVLPQAKFYGVYGSSETGVFACTKADETAYQYCPDGIQIEVLDENDMPTNGVGRLVITNKYRKYFPIQRFDIRDIGKNTGLFEFSVDGREEMASLFPMGDYNLDFFVIFNNCFEHLQQGIVSAQIWIHPAKDDFKVVTSLYFHSTEPVNQEQRDIIKQRFFKDIPLYAADVVQVDNLNDLKRSTRSGKLLQFVDLR